MSDDMPDVIYADPPEAQDNWPSGTDADGHHHVECTTNRTDHRDTPYARIPAGIEPEDAVVVSRAKLNGLIAAEEMPGIAVVEQSEIDGFHARIAAVTEQLDELVEAVLATDASEYTRHIHDLAAKHRP